MAFYHGNCRQCGRHRPYSDGMCEKCGWTGGSIESHEVAVTHWHIKDLQKSIDDLSRRLHSLEEEIRIKKSSQGYFDD